MPAASSAGMTRPGLRFSGLPMMGNTTLLAFLGACTLLALTPGPNLALILANVASKGVASGLWTLAGTTAGLVLLAGAAAAGTTSLMMLMSQWFDVIRWIGALYLIWLGGRTIWRLFRPLTSSQGAGPQAPAGRGMLVQGILVSLSNPKVLLFLGAFLPQFVDATRPVSEQMAVLAVLFVGVVAVFDLAFLLLFARLRFALGGRHVRALDGIAGGMLLLGGLALATLRRP